MKKLMGAVAIVSAAVVIFVGGLSAEGIKEGKWNMTITTRIGGMEDEMNAAMADMSEEDKAMMQQMMGGMMPIGAEGITTTGTQCVTNDNPVPLENEEGCTSTHTMNGSTVNFEMVCPESTSTGEVTYQEESMTGTISSHQTVDGQELDMTIEISGEYTGPCSEE